MKTFFKALFNVFTNWPYLLITLAAAAESILIGGLTGFMAKYIEVQFSVKENMASMTVGVQFLSILEIQNAIGNIFLKFLGVVMVPSAGMGVLISGYVIRAWNFNCSNTMKYTIAMSIVTICLSPSFLIYCMAPKIVGVNSFYPDIVRSGKVQSV